MKIYLLLLLLFTFSCGYEDGFKKDHSKEILIGVESADISYIIGKQISKIEVDTMWGNYLSLYFTD